MSHEYRHFFPAHFAVGLARAAAGALLFSMPLMLTMEMWQLGFTVQPGPMAGLLAVMIPTLVGLAYCSGFEKPVGIGGAIVDGFVAYAVGALVTTVMLSVFAILRMGETTMDELLGKIILQTIPASFGVVLASSQMGEADNGEESNEADLKTTQHAHNDLGSYGIELFLMFAGALFLALNVAPTEEMLLVANVDGNNGFGHARCGRRIGGATHSLVNGTEW